MRMTLSEALKDDIDAINDGVFCVLPTKDSSGRQLLHLEPGRKSDGIPTDSLVRCRFSKHRICHCPHQSKSHIRTRCHSIAAFFLVYCRGHVTR